MCRSNATKTKQFDSQGKNWNKNDVILASLYFTWIFSWHFMLSQLDFLKLARLGYKRHFIRCILKSTIMYEMPKKAENGLANLRFKEGTQ